MAAMHNHKWQTLSALGLIVLCTATGWGAPPAAMTSPARRALRTLYDGRRIGAGIAYGPHRDGQRPGGPDPTREQLAEDLALMSAHWNMLRMYTACGPTETLLDIIAGNDIDMKVMVGAWIAVEEPQDGTIGEHVAAARKANQREIATAIRLANQYPDIVIAVCVGNETQVAWSDHRSPPEVVIRYVRRVREATDVPVTVADDFNFWNKPESKPVADEIDFITMHYHPLWNGVQLEDALAATQRVYAEIQACHPDHTIVIGETGWATDVHDEGEQARLIKGRTGEAEQKIFYDALTAWIRKARIPTFFFEAFDENWKGGSHLDEVEKHWGLFKADRTPKLALEDGDG